MKKLSIFIILVLIIGAIFYFRQKNEEDTIPITVDLHKSWQVSFQFSESESIDTYVEHFNSLSITSMTELITQQENWEYEFEDYGDMGILVTKIRDKENGQDQKYWQYSVNNQQPQISADKYFPPDASYIEWKFIESEF